MLGGVEAKAVSLRDGWKEAEEWALADPNRMVVVCGSLYLMEACVEEQLMEANRFYMV